MGRVRRRFGLEASRKTGRASRMARSGVKSAYGSVADAHSLRHRGRGIRGRGLLYPRGGRLGSGRSELVWSQVGWLRVAFGRTRRLGARDGVWEQPQLRAAGHVTEALHRIRVVPGTYSAGPPQRSASHRRSRHIFLSCGAGPDKECLRTAR